MWTAGCSFLLTHYERTPENSRNSNWTAGNNYLFCQSFEDMEGNNPFRAINSILKAYILAKSAIIARRVHFLKWNTTFIIDWLVKKGKERWKKDNWATKMASWSANSVYTAQTTARKRVETSTSRWNLYLIPKGFDDLNFCTQKHMWTFSWLNITIVNMSTVMEHSPSQRILHQNVSSRHCCRKQAHPLEIILNLAKVKGWTWPHHSLVLLGKNRPYRHVIAIDQLE